MSGGSMDYLYSKVLHCADFPLDTPERIAFAAHLKLVAQALHDIEWVDSGDYGPGDENDAIQACLNPVPPRQKPLTDEQIPALAEKAWKPSIYYDAEALLGTDGLVALVRAVEQAHGIKE